MPKNIINAITDSISDSNYDTYFESYNNSMNNLEYYTTCEHCDDYEYKRYNHKYSWNK